MSLKFLPLPLYVAVCLFISISLIITAKKRARIDCKELIAIYLTVSPIPIFAAIARLFTQFASISSIVIITLILILFVELIIAILKQNDRLQAKRILLFWFGILFISFLPLLIVLIFFNK
jgi:hypothetical protein